MTAALRAGRGKALWVLVFWAVVGVGSYLLGIRTPLGQLAEASVLDAAEFTTDPPPPLNLVSIPSVAIALLLIGLIALAAHGIRRMLVVTIAPALAIAASQALKLHLLTRPQLFELDAPNTFPSGHMTVFAALTAALLWAVPSRIRGFVALGGAALLAAVGWQLLAYGWHRPSDVFGGIALGVVAFAAAALIQPPTPRGTAIGGRVIVIGLGIVGWVIVAGALVLAAVGGTSDNPDLLLSSGEFGAVGLSALAARGMLLLGSGRR